MATSFKQWSELQKKVEPGNTSSGESRAEDIGVSRDGPQIQVNISIFPIFCDGPRSR